MSISYLEYGWKGATHRVELDTDEACRIGRGKLSTITLSDDPTISFGHAVVQRLETDKYYLTDLNSTNGTMLNGRPVTVPTLLRDGDVITIGMCQLIFHQECPFDADDASLPESSRTQVFVSRKLITVLVADIVGYTSLTLKLGESSISEIVGSLFQRAGQILSANQSWTQKYIGDALMGVWVHEKQRPTAQEFGLIFRSVLEINQIFANLNQKYGFADPICFGTGINTGYAAIGNMGSRGFPDYTALGDSVNKAFRLESTTRDLDVNIVLGHLTYDFLSALADTREGLTRHMVHLKGYPHPEEAYATDFGTVAKIVEALQSASARAAP